jgi:hypothetical protein
MIAMNMELGYRQQELLNGLLKHKGLIRGVELLKELGLPHDAYNQKKANLRLNALVNRGFAVKVKSEKKGIQMARFAHIDYAYVVEIEERANNLRKELESTRESRVKICKMMGSIHVRMPHDDCMEELKRRDEFRIRQYMLEDK